MTVLLCLVLAFAAAGCRGSASDPAERTDTTAAPMAGAGPSLTTNTALITTAAATAPPPTPIPAPPILREETPPLVEVDGWLGSEVSSLEDLRGKVVVVEFWTFGCYNCRNRIPHTQELYAEYQDQGLEIVGIHSPEFAYEQEVGNIEEAMIELGVTWPVVLDTERRTFRAWQGRPAYWPRTYVLDRQGRVRFDHIGEGAYEELEQAVVHLLAEGA